MIVFSWQAAWETENVRSICKEPELYCDYENETLPKEVKYCWFLVQHSSYDTELLNIFLNYEFPFFRKNLSKRRSRQAFYVCKTA